ncbi:MAG: hypothetical protein GY772_18485 [bacterium]|nr:hypothetical protein [Deltaproteobacteria bacterium]MCP4242545.1 hypothetical protein [bacterium]MDP7300111.1 hypothetical protein [Myxococcota bacterium]HJO24036.1 hypothetical protein [Myxococcota bacterium]
MNLDLPGPRSGRRLEECAALAFEAVGDFERDTRLDRGGRRFTGNLSRQIVTRVSDRLVASGGTQLFCVLLASEG